MKTPLKQSHLLTQPLSLIHNSAFYRLMAYPYFPLFYQIKAIIAYCRSFLKDQYFYIQYCKYP